MGAHNISVWSETVQSSKTSRTYLWTSGQNQSYSWSQRHLLTFDKKRLYTGSLVIHGFSV